TPHGDAEATFAALIAAAVGPRTLGLPLGEQLLHVAGAACAGVRPDLVLLATTKADCDAWCDGLVARDPSGIGGPGAVARDLGRALGAPAFTVSAACASGPAAIGVAARRIALGHARRVLVVGGDRVGAFVRDGFACLRALSPTRCAPFDATRDGLMLGETAAAILLVADDGGPGARLSGWGARMDANHLTGPSRDGRGLREACAQALARGGDQRTSLIVAHGTGTRYNDDAESLAYAALAPHAPVTGFKGLLGHSLGACGVTEAALALTIRRHARAPGVVGLQQVGTAGAISVLTPGGHAVAPGAILLANAGFGGIDAATVIGDEPARPLRERASDVGVRVVIDAAGWHRREGDDERHGSWSEPANDDGMPRLTAREVLGRVEATWGRMDTACRALVALGHLAGDLPEDSAVVLVSERGCAASDRAFEIARRGGQADPQRFPYTLPSTAVGEASIRLRLRGAGLALVGADDAQARDAARDLISEGAPAVLLARVEADAAPLLAWAEVWRPRPAI
ncbi:MAG TPA: beta-ketoacyl synthase N-terminal-like domain-containing protein, partial [Planctomycetota bacterium]|nr:beta-ketoacyl synthase N-terminal-like domain-containing protein [Planctomycetota bacterium]